MNTRVLVIGAHPDDEDTFLISWLSRGRHVETAYLSLTRGDGGQNLIGNELGDALGVIRTEELLAARRVDGGQQFFTRAYDFGFSKDTIDTYAHWPRDSLLGDVVQIVRAFRPHVIVAVFSGTARDGHGHHQVSGLLAREAYEIAGDTVRFPTREYGAAWTPLKFYRAARFNPGAATTQFDVGEYSPLLGRSFAEIAGESRSQHKSQGFGAPQRKGPVFDYLRREASRVNDATTATSEQSLFDGIDTTWNRFKRATTQPVAAMALDSLPAAIAAVRAAYDPFNPSRLLPPLARARRLLASVRGSPNSDLESAVALATARLDRAFQLAAGVEIDAVAPRESYPAGRAAAVVTSVFNRGRDTVIVNGRPLPPASARQDTQQVTLDAVTQPWWLRTPRGGAMFSQPVSRISETLLGRRPAVSILLSVPGLAEPVRIEEPVVFRNVDAVKGELHRLVAAVPAIAVTLDQRIQYASANSSIDRQVEVHLRSADEQPRAVRVTLALPRGLTADSVMRTARLGGYDEQQTVTFRVRGRLPAGSHRIAALAESNGETFGTGYERMDYDHIRRQRLYRPATTTIAAVDVTVPAALKVAYIAGVGDNVAPTLAQLGIPVTVIPAIEVARADLSSFTTTVIGPRAYEAHPELVAANAHLLAFARNGGTLLVQYGQTEMLTPGVMPYPITLTRPADRVTEEGAPVTIDPAGARELTGPNRITPSDFAGWVQERALYMPRTFDDRYRSMIAMNDTGEPANRAAILVAPLGEGLYVYTTLSFFRQLPAGVPGAARIFVNLLSAGLAPRLTP